MFFSLEVVFYPKLLRIKIQITMFAISIEYYSNNYQPNIFTYAMKNRYQNINNWKSVLLQLTTALEFKRQICLEPISNWNSQSATKQEIILLLKSENKNLNTAYNKCNNPVAIYTTANQHCEEMHKMEVIISSLSTLTLQSNIKSWQKVSSLSWFYYCN